MENHFWSDISSLMGHLEQVETYQKTGRIKPLTIESNNGDLVRFGGYSWIVVSKSEDEEGKYLLITNKLLGIMPMKYYHEKADVTWETSAIREYLNNKFFNKINTEDQEKILEINNSNPITPWFDTPGGNDTVDKVFLLSHDELVRYLGDSGQLSKKGWPREGAIDPSKPCIVSDEYDNLHSAKNEFGESFHYWLRSPGRDASSASIVREDGTIDLAGEPVDSTAGVRPALWVKL